MKEKTRKIFFCDFCRKYYLKKYFCENHEKFCYYNPNNKHKCLSCKFLKKVPRFDNETEEFFGYHFLCEKLKYQMFSYVAEKIKHDDVKNKHCIRMPLECNYWETIIIS